VVVQQEMARRPHPTRDLLSREAKEPEQDYQALTTAVEVAVVTMAAEEAHQTLAAEAVVQDL
jgi:hypothetical protein